MKWCIVGGGIQAITIALKLRILGLEHENLTIIDPNNQLCSQFSRFTERISMPYLRSPIVHHVHPNPFHLKQYCKKNEYSGGMYGQYKRPQRNMFMDHIDDLIREYRLDECHVCDVAIDIHRMGKMWEVVLENRQNLEVDNVIIASGCNHKPYIPEIFTQHEDIQHIFDDGTIEYDKTSHIVGSGISAIHLAIKLLTENEDKHIHLWTKKPLEVHDFDADPGWLGPKYMKGFLNMESSIEKMNMLLNERHKGSMPQELYLRIKKYIFSGRLTIHENACAKIENHSIITHDGDVYDYDHILLATGFENTLLKQPLIQSLINEYHAPLTECGYPEISYNLEWLEGLYVAGGLADLQLGAFARNVMGGREAANRISEKYARISS